MKPSPDVLRRLLHHPATKCAASCMVGALLRRMNDTTPRKPGSAA